MRRLFKKLLFLPLRVCIGDRNVAYKGSIAKHDSVLHMQLPETIRFIKVPDNKGEVTGVTADVLKRIQK